MKKFLIYSVSVITFFTFLSCEKKTDTIVDNVIAVPLITNASLTYTQIHLDTTTNESVVRFPNNEYQLFNTIRLEASHPQGLDKLQKIVFRVLPPRSSEVIAQGELVLYATAIGGVGIFKSSLSFRINRGQAGLFRIESYATDKWGNRSSSMILPLYVLRNNSKPRLSNLIIPDTLVRPITGFVPFKFFVTVSDSDGYKDINHVFFKQLLPTESEMILLFDDGNELITGDQSAGDGIFSRIVRIDSSNSLGDRLLLFQAIDNAGAFSDSLFGTFTIIK